ncbi:MAG TPA: hypothetical protein VEH06_00540 [Candidatus Bathyarchaeia archaeon]|nr:hypothetical protein [Candidatus Bathyarchaeia archaeon]
MKNIWLSLACDVFSNSAIFKAKSMVILHTMDMTPKVSLEDLDIKPYMITKLKMAGIKSVFDFNFYPLSASVRRWRHTNRD